jgi:hypothetical protein
LFSFRAQTVILTIIAIGFEIFGCDWSGGVLIGTTGDSLKASESSAPPLTFVRNADHTPSGPPLIQFSGLRVTRQVGVKQDPGSKPDPHSPDLSGTQE